MRTFRAAPSADVLIESMRDVGYSLETALADVIDNSLTAGARNIRLLARTTGFDPCIGVLDDGEGMDEATLHAAMRLGSSSPLQRRHATDLGRFGLGLKTASFSQCRRVTVVSRREGVVSTARWDLAEVGDWQVQVPEPLDIHWFELLGPTGTLVLWEDLDRVAGAELGDARSAQIVRRIDDAVEHLELVFHRYLSGEAGLKKVAISMNGRVLSPIDPFNSRHPKTISTPSDPELIKVGANDVWFQTFTLPHHSSLSAAEWDKFGGRAGYLKNQGFYLYRARRLIVHGTWFGLARQTELTKLVRVRIDIPNSMDSDWKIDVKKASAHPPHQVRERLKRLIETIGATSKRVYTARGRKLISDSQLPVWVRRQAQNEISYSLNSDHPVFADFRNRLPDDMQRDFLRIVEMAGATMPLDAVFADISGDPSKVGGSAMSDEAVDHVAIVTCKQLMDAGLSLVEIKEMMRVTEPFRSNWTRVEHALSKAETGPANQ